MRIEDVMKIVEGDAEDWSSLKLFFFFDIFLLVARGKKLFGIRGSWESTDIYSGVVNLV